LITIAIANQKGVVGKTTTAVNLSAALSRHGSRVLLVDLDAQASATLWCTGDYGAHGRVVYDLLMRRAAVKDCLVEAGAGFWLLPSDLWLSSLDIDLQNKVNRDRRLATVLEEVDFDYALVDCPPSLGLATVNALVAADVVIVPIDCRLQSFLAVPQLLQVLADIIEEYKRSIELFALPTFFQRTRLAKRTLAAIEEKFRHRTLPAIHQNTKLGEAFGVQKTIIDYDPGSLGALNYMRAAAELSNALETRQSRRSVRQDREQRS
jgi:chromosome partitioning protein